MGFRQGEAADKAYAGSRMGIDRDRQQGRRQASTKRDDTITKTGSEFVIVPLSVASLGIKFHLKTFVVMKNR